MLLSWQPNKSRLLLFKTLLNFIYLKFVSILAMAKPQRKKVSEILTKSRLDWRLLQQCGNLSDLNDITGYAKQPGRTELL